MSNVRSKRYKRVRLFLIFIITILLFFTFKISNEYKIVKLVNNNLDFLNECIEHKTYDKIYEIKSVKSIKPYSLGGNELYIDFYCYGFGIVPSSIYYGFYYVSDDKPLGFQATHVKLESDGDGWKWKEPDGDNWYYTKRIADHWYYYEAGF